MAIPRLPFDKTGINPQNRILNELHTVVLGGPRIIILNEGSFFTGSLQVVKASDGSLVSNAKLSRLDPEVTALTGKEVGFGVFIDTENFSGDVLVTYQAVGGYEGKGIFFYQELAAALEAAGTGAVSWEQIDHPETFTPSEHAHSIHQLTELEVVRNSLDGLTDALMKSRTTGITGNALDGRLNRLLALMGSLRNDVNKLSAGGSGNGSIEELDSINSDMDELATLNLEMALRQLRMEKDIITINDILKRLMDSLGTILEDTSNSISVN